MKTFDDAIFSDEYKVKRNSNEYKLIYCVAKIEIANIITVKHAL